MSKDFPSIKVMGERAILVEFAPEINELLLEKLLFYKNVIQKNYGELIVEVINTFHSLLIYYARDIENVYSEVLVIKGLLDTAKVGKKNQTTLFHIPVCYEEEFGIDLSYVAAEKKLDNSQIIGLHASPVYTVYFIGFLPGFLYLGGLDKRLAISRRNEPRLEVKKGAVGIGEYQTGIYPKSSPGGWQIIGNSPVELFDKKSLPPCEISAGDKVKFYPVSKQEYLEIKETISLSGFQLKRENYES